MVDDFPSATDIYGYGSRRKAGTTLVEQGSLRLNRLPRIRHRRGEAAVDRDRLAVDVGGVVARKEQSHRRELVRLAGALQRIELADLVLRAAFLGAVEHRLGHPCFDQAGADRVDA